MPEKVFKASTATTLEQLTPPRRGDGPMNPAEQQLNLADYAREVEVEQQEVVKATRKNRESRTYIVFATDPAKVGQDDYKLVFACKARTVNEAENKVQPLVRTTGAFLPTLHRASTTLSFPKPAGLTSDSVSV